MRVRVRVRFGHVELHTAQRFDSLLGFGLGLGLELGFRIRVRVRIRV